MDGVNSPAAITITFRAYNTQDKQSHSTPYVLDEWGFYLVE